MSGADAHARSRALVGWALAALCAVSALAMLPWPMYWDHGIFVMVAQSIRTGAAPYVGAFDTKGPVGFLPYVLVLGLPAAPATAIRIADIVLLAATAAVIEPVLRTYVPSLLGRRVVTTLVVLGYVASGAVMTAQPDGWCALLLTAAAVWALVGFHRSSALWWGVMYGASVGTCVWVKPTFLIFVLPPLAAAPWLARADRGRLLRALAGVAAGGALVTAAVLLWMAARGGLHALVEVQWEYNRTVYAVVDSLSYPQRVGALVHELLRGSRFFLLPVLAPGAVAFFGDRGIARAVRAYAAAVLAVAVVNLLVQGKFIPYQWFPLTIPLSVIAGVGYVRAVAGAYADGAAPNAVRGAVVGALGIALAAHALEPLREVGRSAALALGRTGRDSYLSLKDYTNTYNALSDVRVARYLGARLAPSEPFGLWGLVSTVPVLANRPVVSRFVHTSMLAFGSGALVDAYRAEYLAAFDRARPRYFIYPAGGAPDSVPAALVRRQFPALWARLNAAYAVDTVLPGYVVLRREPGR